MSSGSFIRLTISDGFYMDITTKRVDMMHTHKKVLFLIEDDSSNKRGPRNIGYSTNLKI